MSARRKAKPAGPLPDGWNVVEFPSGKGAVPLDDNQRIRAAFESLARGYNQFIDNARPLWKQRDDMKVTLNAINLRLDRLWDQMEDAGVVKR